MLETYKAIYRALREKDLMILNRGFSKNDGWNLRLIEPNFFNPLAGIGFTKDNKICVVLTSKEHLEKAAKEEEKEEDSNYIAHYNLIQFETIEKIIKRFKNNPFVIILKSESGDHRHVETMIEYRAGFSRNVDVPSKTLWEIDPIAAQNAKIRAETSKEEFIPVPSWLNLPGLMWMNDPD